MPDAAAQGSQPILRSFYPQQPGLPADSTATITPAGPPRMVEWLLRRLRHPLRRHGLRVVPRNRLQPALLLQEVRLLREGLRRRAIRAAAEPFRRGLLLEAREAVELHRGRNVLDLAARPFRNRLRLIARRRPLVGICLVVGIGLRNRLDERDHELRVLLRELARDDQP